MGRNESRHGLPCHNQTHGAQAGKESRCLDVLDSKGSETPCCGEESGLRLSNTLGCLGLELSRRAVGSNSSIAIDCWDCIS